MLCGTLLCLSCTAARLPPTPAPHAQPTQVQPKEPEKPIYWRTMYTGEDHQFDCALGLTQVTDAWEWAYVQRYKNEDTLVFDRVECRNVKQLRFIRYAVRYICKPSGCTEANATEWQEVTLGTVGYALCDLAVKMCQ